MKVSLIHFSDIHFREGENHLNDKFNALKATFNQIDLNTEHVIVAITGDIAFSGKQEEYRIASAFCEEVSKTLSRFKQTWVLTPGNHDCQFTPNKMRDLCIKHLDDYRETIEKDEMDICTSPQAGFFDFVNSGIWQIGIRDGNLSHYKDVNIGSSVIRLNCINTAWCSSNPEHQTLVYPIKRLPYPTPDKCFSITLMHHALPWFESDNGREIFSVIEQQSDLVLVGHQHLPGIYKKDDIFHGRSSIYVEGGVLQERDLPDQSIFHRLDIHIPNATFDHYTYTWNSAKQNYDTFVVSESVSIFNPNINKGGKFILSKPMIDFLEDVGTGFSHPKKNKIKAMDLFIPPDLLLTSRTSNKTKTIYSKNLINYIIDNGKLIISGGELTGKTALSKWIFQELYKQHQLPVLIDNNNILDPNPKNIDRIIAKAVSFCYDGPDLDLWKSSDVSKRIIIVDDFNAKQLNRIGYSEILSRLESYADRIILLVDGIFNMEEAIGGRDKSKDGKDEQTVGIVGYKRLEIKLFRKRLRSELIKKWIRLGREFELTDSMEEQEAELLAERVDAVIQKDVVQPCPFFVLSVLQILQTSQSPSITSFGHVYHKLISDRLVIPKWAEGLGVTADIIEMLLTLIAIKQHEDDGQVVSGEILSELHIKYCREFSLRFALVDFIKIVVENSLLSKATDGYRFKYKYIYYYFVAKYYQNGLSSPKRSAQIREKLSIIAKNLQNEDNSNILMFFVYLTKDEITITEMLAYAESLYSDYSLLSIDEDAHMLCDSPELLPTVHVGNEDVKANKETTLQKLDDEEEEQYCGAKKDHNGHPSKEKRDEVEEVVKLNSAFKTMQMLGHMLRNFPGGLDGDVKTQIATQGISLGLRSIKFVFSSLAEHHEDLKLEFIGFIKKRHPSISEIEREQYLKSMFSMLGIALIIGGIKTITTNMGAPLLRSIYEDTAIQLQNDTVDFIDFAIKLDYVRPFPKTDVIAFGAKHRDSIIKNHIGARLVGWYFFLHEHDLGEKQEVCSAFDIKFSQRQTISEMVHDVAEQVSSLKTQPMAERYLQITRAKLLNQMTSKAATSAASESGKHGILR